jgi:hypothetical protein
MSELLPVAVTSIILWLTLRGLGRVEAAAHSRALSGRDEQTERAPVGEIVPSGG